MANGIINPKMLLKSRFFELILATIRDNKP